MRSLFTCLRSIIAWHKIVGIFTGPLTPTLGPVEPLLEAIIVLGVEWSVLYWMYKYSRKS
jgi:hypothetical protein